MNQERTLLAQFEARDPAEVTNLCATGLAQLDEALHFLWINAALSDLLGSGARRWQGAALDLLDTKASGMADAARRALDGQYRVVLRHARLSGGNSETEFVADVVFTPLEGRRLLLELHQITAPSETTSPGLSESLRGFAHEVKNPLAGVRGAAQLIGRRVETPELSELAALIIGEADRLSALADRLLHAGGKPSMAPLNLHELLERVAALISAEPSAPVVRRDYDPSLPAAIADVDRLYQLVLNLARNAVEAGASTLTLRTRVEFGVRLCDRLRRVALRIDVIDDGRGIPPEIAASLYQPLVSGRSDGTGLGLALAQEIAREHGGELRHTSRPGATSFILMLPLELAA